MECRQVRKNIPAFVEDELEGKELREFIDHIYSCPECKEELSIHFLVTEGMYRLENSSTYDLQSQLEEKLAKAGKSISSRNKVLIFMYICEAIVILSVVLMILLLLLR